MAQYPNYYYDTRVAPGAQKLVETLASPNVAGGGGAPIASAAGAVRASGPSNGIGQGLESGASNFINAYSAMKGQAAQDKAAAQAEADKAAVIKARTDFLIQNNVAPERAGVFAQDADTFQYIQRQIEADKAAQAAANAPDVRIINDKAVDIKHGGNVLYDGSTPKPPETYTSPNGDKYERAPGGEWKIAIPNDKPQDSPWEVTTIEQNGQKVSVERNKQTGQVRPVQGVGGPDGVQLPAATPDAQDEQKLREEVIKGDQTYIALRRSQQTLVTTLTGEPSAAKDMAAIYSWMHALDPTSTVREGEFASAENARGVPDTIRNFYNKVADGTPLTPEQRRSILNASMDIYNNSEAEHNDRATYYEELAKEYGYDPKRIVRRFKPITMPDSSKKPDGVLPAGPDERGGTPDYKSIYGLD